MKTLLCTSFLGIILLWVTTELLVYRRKIEQMHSLSRHIIVHQKHSRLYQTVLNFLFLLSVIVTIFSLQGGTVINCVIIVLLVWLTHDLLYCYDLKKNITEQFVQNNHNIGVAILFSAVLYYKNQFNTTLFLLLTLLGFLSVQEEKEDTTPQFVGVIELVLLLLLVLN